MFDFEYIIDIFLVNKLNWTELYKNDKILYCLLYILYNSKRQHGLIENSSIINDYADDSVIEKMLSVLHW